MRRFSFDHRQVDFAGATASKLLAQARRRLGCAGKHHDSCHRPIKAMNQAQKNIARFLMALLDPLFSKIQQADIAALVALNQKPGRFIENEQVIVGVKNRPAPVKKWYHH